MESKSTRERENASARAGVAKASKFGVYQNPALSAAMSARSLHPSKYTFHCILFFSIASASTLAFLSSREEQLFHYIIVNLNGLRLGQHTAHLIVKMIKGAVSLVFIASMLACYKVFTLHGLRSSPSKVSKDQPTLTAHQLQLLGSKPKAHQVASSEPSKKPPKSKPTRSTPPSEPPLVPLHQFTMTTSATCSSPGSSNNKLNTTGGGTKMRLVTSPSKSPSPSTSLYLVPAGVGVGVGVSPLASSQHHSTSLDSAFSTPWSNSKRTPSMKEITSEEMLELFLAQVDDKITESAGKLATPPPTISGLGIASPKNLPTSANTSGTTRSTPLRPVRMSPGSQKFTTPPKKGEGDLPTPMSLEEATEAFEHLGIYPQVELWRDRLRQWFSTVLLNPLLRKIDRSHHQVMQAAAKLGILITVSQVGSDSSSTGTPVSSVDRTKEWFPAITLDEDGLLQQLQSTLMQALNASMSKPPLGSMQQSPQQNLIPLMQDCLDAITEHQRLNLLVKGELLKGLLPQSSVSADYMVRRIRDLAEGTCVKNYEYPGSGEVSDNINKKWIPDLPTDSHLLLYLFCAFLEHPKWMLHVDPSSYAGAQSSKNPLFLGILPPKERFPEKYAAIISSIPSTLHPGACILIVGRKSPPVFALYWDKKLQFVLQGRTATWDSILLLCHNIKVGFGGIVRGLHLGSSALNILPVLDPETDESVL